MGLCLPIVAAPKFRRRVVLRKVGMRRGTLGNRRFRILIDTSVGSCPVVKGTFTLELSNLLGTPAKGAARRRRLEMQLGLCWAVLATCL